MQLQLRSGQYKSFKISDSMKNLIVFVSFIFMSNFYLIAQKEIQFSASVSENVSFDFPKTGNVYLGTNLQL